MNLKTALVSKRVSKRKSAAMLPKGLLWVDGIIRSRQGDWDFDVRCLRDRRIEKDVMPWCVGAISPLIDAHAKWLRASMTDMLPLEIKDLARSELVLDSNDVLGCMARGIESSNRHSLYKVSDNPAVYVPALLLIRLLFSGSALLDKILFTPNGIDLLGHAREQDGSIEVIPGPAYRNPQRSPTIPRLIAWTQLCSDARRAHSSVLSYAMQGLINMDLPSMTLRCWAWCIRTDVGFLAFDINGSDLHLPIDADQISVQSGNVFSTFDVYTAPIKGPWAKSRADNNGW